MATSSKTSKRKLSVKSPIGPPPLRQKVQSTTTQNAVASFFTPVSQKTSESDIWQERGPNEGSCKTLLVCKYSPRQDSDIPDSMGSEMKRTKVAAFDLDSTLIKSLSGKKFVSNAHDWQWWHPSVPVRLRKLYVEDGFHVAVMSNQAGLSLKASSDPKSKVLAFKTKVLAAFSHLGVPISMYAATEKDFYRKPGIGMWKMLLNDLQVDSGSLDLENSVFVGDAAGRLSGHGKPKDFSCSDRNFAENIGIKFATPEEFFLGQETRPFSRTFEPSQYVAKASREEFESYCKRNPCEMVLFCGSPGAGKSTWYWKNLQNLGYTRINQDMLKSRERCLKVASQYLNEGKSVVIGELPRHNTNADTKVRKQWVELAVKHHVPIRCVHFTTPSEVCLHNDIVRALNNVMNPERRTVLPGIAFHSFAKRFESPQLSEGFQDITAVAFKFQGSEVERSIWSRYWT